jgi:hypothetical protein
MVSAEKSTVTLFTSWPKEAKIEPDIYINNVRIPICTRPKVLGLTHDTMYTFADHTKRAAERMRKTNNVLKALSGSTWGQDKETLVMTYKATSRSVGEYAVPIWGTIASDSSWKKIQTAENEALRIATGCHLMADSDHLHRETKVLPIRSHSKMLTKQFILACHQDNHPGSKHLRQAPMQRNKKTTSLVYEDEIKRLAPNVPITLKEYRSGLKKIHTQTTADVLGGYSVNKLLNRPPPEIDKSEHTLGRESRTLLSQLRSSYCRILNSYKSRIDPNIRNICPNCSVTPHDANHLFNCKKHPTSLTVTDLWYKPGEAAEQVKVQNL